MNNVCNVPRPVFGDPCNCNYTFVARVRKMYHVPIIYKKNYSYTHNHMCFCVPNKLQALICINYNNKLLYKTRKNFDKKLILLKL